MIVAALVAIDHGRFTRMFAHEEARRREPGIVRVEICDEGEGIAEPDRERVFERFERLATSRGGMGVGIGLHLSRERARRMGATCAASTVTRTRLFQLAMPAGR